jgi:hypothetical protein
VSSIVGIELISIFPLVVPPVEELVEFELFPPLLVEFELFPPLLVEFELFPPLLVEFELFPPLLDDELVVLLQSGSSEQRFSFSEQQPFTQQNAPHCEYVQPAPPVEVDEEVPPEEEEELVPHRPNIQLLLQHSLSE